MFSEGHAFKHSACFSPVFHGQDLQGFSSGARDSAVLSHMHQQEEARRSANAILMIGFSRAEVQIMKIGSCQILALNPAWSSRHSCRHTRRKHHANHHNMAVNQNIFAVKRQKGENLPLGIPRDPTFYINLKLQKMVPFAFEVSSCKLYHCINLPLFQLSLCSVKVMFVVFMAISYCFGTSHLHLQALLACRYFDS